MRELKFSTKDDQGRRRFAEFLHEELEAAERVREPHEGTWREVEAAYRNAPGSAGLRAIKGKKTVPIPLMSPRIERIANSLHQAIVTATPLVQAVNVQADKDYQALETTYDYIYTLSGFGFQFRRAAVLGALLGLGIIRTRLTSQGLEFDVIHPADFFVAPTYGMPLHLCHLTGHRFQAPMYAVWHKTQTGEYYKDANLGKIAETLGERYGGQPDGKHDYHSQERYNYTVDLVEGYYYGNVNGEQGVHRFVIHRQSTCLLACKRMPYNRHPYDELRLGQQYDHNVFWPSTSVGRNLLGLQDIYTECHNMLADGSRISAFPPVLVSEGSITRKIQSYLPGQLIPVGAGFSAQTLPVNFDAKAYPELIGQIERVADAVAGISQIGLGQEFSKSTTATEASLLAAVQQQTENAYAMHAAAAVESITEHLHYELIRRHAATFEAAYPGINPEAWGQFQDPVRFEVTGKNAQNTTVALFGKLQQLFMMSQDPRTDLKYSAIEKLAVSALQLPTETQSLFGGRQENQQLFAQLGGQAPGMGDGGGGTPGGPGASPVAGLAGGPGGIGARSQFPGLPANAGGLPV